MAQRVITTMEDDLDGGEADETVRFGLDGTEYEIDLNTANAAKLRGELAKYKLAARHAKPAVASSRRVRRVSSVSGVPRHDLAEIRTWASENGFSVAPRGRVPGNVVEAYKNATADTAEA